jgi:hypothetical protein
LGDPSDPFLERGLGRKDLNDPPTAVGGIEEVLLLFLNDLEDEGGGVASPWSVDFETAAVS